MMTVEDCMRAAWSALLRGDKAGRDRYVALARNLLNARARMQKAGAARQIVRGKIIRLPDGSAELTIVKN